ncbi:DNA-damage-inducible protein F [Aquimixticola soesokkakensis]|uniref:DNA-damage-inducible protein F n=1 Tax=Aquimixticola soesokkakensis TaxID=1519096 RepID=A0A1Y5TQB6_9RHOB|nr:MATE family efflux transporter [Aquimixticola soesokkakensis]SLN67593.1 DNA-damage-inducible protein F [Aquimixticola soesokkakensis]
MTTPPIRLSHARVLKIALPIVLANATVPILGAVDTGVVGQLGLATPIGAVGVGATVLASIYWIFGFLRMGTTGLVSQAQGARDAGEVSALLTRAVMIAALAGLVLIAFQGPIMAAAFALAPASEAVETLARDYIGVRVWSAPAAIAVYGLTGWLIALERTRAVLILQLVMNGVNILLDLWFVLGLGWGVSGVAGATVMSEVMGAALGLWLCRDAFARGAWRDWPRVFERARVIRMALVNTDILIRSLFLLAIMVSFTFFSSGFGDVPLAANQILMQFLSITAFALDGFAFAAEAIVGQALGARDRGTLRRGALLASFWGLIGALLLTLAFGLFGGRIIDLMTTAPQVREEARAFLPWMIATPLVGLASWMFDGIFIGATRSRDMRNMAALSAAIYFAAAYALMGVFGNHGLWMALLVSYVARAVTLAARYPALERAAV